MNALKDKRVYLSGPIEHETGRDWRTGVKKSLGDIGLDVFDPSADPKQQWKPALEEARRQRDFEKMAKIAKDFCSKDLSVVSHCDLLIAYLPFGVPTTGTHHEIINAARDKKPVLLVSDKPKEFLPVWYYGFIKTRHMFDTWEDLFGYLKEVNDGKHQDDRRWAFTYGLI
jgi:nucleoside 2-deoxyribosyltransferase